MLDVSLSEWKLTSPYRMESKKLFSQDLACGFSLIEKNPMKLKPCVCIAYTPVVFFLPWETVAPGGSCLFPRVEDVLKSSSILLEFVWSSRLSELNRLSEVLAIVDENGEGRENLDWLPFGANSSSPKDSFRPWETKTGVGGGTCLGCWVCFEAQLAGLESTGCCFCSCSCRSCLSLSFCALSCKAASLFLCISSLVLYGKWRKGCLLPRRHNSSCSCVSGPLCHHRACEHFVTGSLFFLPCHLDETKESRTWGLPVPHKLSVMSSKVFFASSVMHLNTQNEKWIHCPRKICNNGGCWSQNLCSLPHVAAKQWQDRRHNLFNRWTTQQDKGSLTSVLPPYT